MKKHRDGERKTGINEERYRDGKGERETERKRGLKKPGTKNPLLFSGKKCVSFTLNHIFYFNFLLGKS